jgi:hypothetical protein
MFETVSRGSWARMVCLVMAMDRERGHVPSRTVCRATQPMRRRGAAMLAPLWENGHFVNDDVGVLEVGGLWVSPMGGASGELQNGSWSWSLSLVAGRQDSTPI